MKKKLLALVLCATMACGMVGACGKKTEPVESEKPVTEQTEEADTQEESEECPDGLARSYLTGEWIDENLASNRPIAMMIENTKVCLPTYGSSNADIIYEYPVEGGISRLMGIYQDYSGMDKMGNVRSSRPYYVLTAKEYDAIYVHAGGSVEAYELLDRGIIDDIDSLKASGSTCYFRSDDKRSIEHNLYTTSEKLSDAITNAGYRTTHTKDYKGNFKFNKDDANEITLKDGVDAAVVTINLVNPKPWFVYNEEDGLYYRYEFGEKQMDNLENQQLAVKNIVIQYTNICYYDDSKKTYLNIDKYCGGEGRYITNGKCIDITWSKESEDAPTKYFDKEGNELVINQGKTWVITNYNSAKDKDKIYSTMEDYENR